MPGTRDEDKFWKKKKIDRIWILFKPSIWSLVPDIFLDVTTSYCCLICGRWDKAEAVAWELQKTEEKIKPSLNWNTFIQAKKQMKFYANEQINDH